MAAPNPMLSDQRYRNWLRDTLSLLHMKEALVKIVETDALLFHQGLQKALGVLASSTCSSCTQNDIRKNVQQRKWWMKCRLCDQWLQQIVNNHANKPMPNIHTDNTDPQLWPTNPYEVFKCYMPYGCQKDQSAKDGDLQGILNLLRKCLYFGSCGRIGRLDLVDELLEIRNSLFHSGNFLVDSSKLQTDMQTMLDFLRGLTALSGVEQSAVDEAIDKILQLQANKIDLSLNRELELQALQQQQIALERDLGTQCATLKAVDSEVKILQKDVTSAKAKGAATDLAVKTIQADLGTNSSRLTAVDSEVKILQKDVKSAKAKGAATDLAVKTIQTDLGTNSSRLTAVDSEVKILQKDVKSAKAKGAATDLAVKTIQTDLGTNSSKLTAVDSEVKILQKDVKSAKAKGAATDLAVKTIQTDLGTNSSRLTAVDSEVKILQKDVTSAKAKGAATDLAVKTIQTDLGTNSSKLTAVDSDVKSLQKDVTSAKAKGAATDLAVKTIQTDLGTNSSRLTAVDSEVKILQKDVTSAKAKGAATDLAVKTIQTDLGTNSSRLTAVDSEVMVLQKDVKSAKAKGAATDLAVKTIQTDLGTNSSKLTAVDSDVKSLQKDVTSAKAKGAATDLAVKTIQTDLGTNSSKLTAVDSEVKILQKDVTSAKAIGAATDLAVKTIQTDLGTNSSRLTAVYSEVKILQKDVTSAKAKGAATDLAVKTIQTDLGTNSSKLTAVDSEVKILQKDVTSAKAKGAATDLAVKTIQTDLGTNSSRLTAVDSEVKILQKDVTSAKAKGAATDLAVKTIQTDVDVHTIKLSTVDSDMKILQEAVTSATAKSSATELDVKKLTEETKGFELRMQKQVTDQGSTCQDQMTTLYQRQQQAETGLQAQQEKSQAHQSQIQSLQAEQVAVRAEQVAVRAELQAHKDSPQETAETREDTAALQKYLVSFYRRMCLTIPNPVEDDDVGLNRLYVDPDIRVLRETTDPSAGLKKVEDQATTSSQCRRLFKTKNYRCEQIYLTGDAGSGKSMFCKHLVSLWCEAHGDTDEHTSSNRDDGSASSSSKRHVKINEQKEEDKKIMSDFPLLFYITLRDVLDIYHIEDMIDDQIFQQNDDMQYFKASVVLKKCCCLVILDGLDEWVRPTNAKPLRFLNPGIPGRNRLNKSNVFLTTTRPWKLDVLSLKSSEIDKHAELVGFDSMASKTLYSQLSHLLNKSGKVHTSYDKFEVELEKKDLSHSHNLPVILTQLICLTFDGQDLGQSQVQLYCSMLEMLLKRSEKTRSATLNTEHSENLLPKCFIEYNLCQANQDLLLKLGKVAFEALFNQEREKSLVFKSSQISMFGVDKESIDLCLKSGILSQNKVLGKRSVCEKEMSFLHKKLQEFLAAIFITHNEERENVLSRVKSYCSTVETVLEMSVIFMFFFGIKPDVGCELLTDLMTRVVFNDTAVQQYRQNTDYHDDTCIRSIQTCIVDCIVEATSNGHSGICLPLQDFIIHHVTISECLKSLMTSNIASVKSVYIYTGGLFTGDMTPDDVEFVARTLHQLQDKQCLQKLYLNDLGNVNFDDETLSKTITNNSNLSSLVLQRISLSTETSAAVCGALKHLTALQLSGVKLPHKEKQRLLSSVSQAATLRQLRLGELLCTDHGYDCRPGIDISQLNTSCLQHIELSCVTIQERHLRQCVRQLSSVSHKVTVKLDWVKFTADSENPVDLSYLTLDRCLVVTRLGNTWGNTWDIHFHTQQQTTT